MKHPRPSPITRVFVSSTCYDLVDVRAEIRAALEADGLLVSMSDVAETFELDGRADSIETCLANLRSSDAVVLVLSQRYGPPLKPLNTQKSATHVEYDEAVRHSKPIYVYIRDRLASSYDQWVAGKRSAMPASHWSTTKDLEGLLPLIDEQKKLDPAKPTTNWQSVFSTSVELTKLIRAHLGVHGGTSVVERLQREGKLGGLTLSVSNDGNIFFRNISSEVVYDARLIRADSKSRALGNVSRDGAVGNIPSFLTGDAVDVRVEWTSLQCGRLRDYYRIERDGICALHYRRLLTPTTIQILGPTDPDPVW